MPVFRTALWIGRILSGLVILFLVMDGGIKLVPIKEVTETMQQLGYSGSMAQARGLGVLTLLCALLYAIPRTSVFGAILLTGLLGGAMATHLRVDSPLFTHLLFGFYIGVMAWGGLYLRDPAMRAMIPIRNQSFLTGGKSDAGQSLSSL
ncbi:DoxX family protein [Tardiphaga sp. 866_E4_N2_1]|uniref:DoxX family protein n=1 Tax=unclassified Tardiphaga TaxID=2631404 RepID=UPI003F249F96